ncbi:MAG TPA: hypothetical protein VM529_12300 [Gemmata sp.]|nr:hypothetical protein [Gemmata sp.]
MGVEGERSMRLAGRKWPGDLLLAVGVYAVTSLPFLFGLALALTPGVMVHQDGRPPTFLQYSLIYDGAYFRDIADRGYWVHEDRQSGIAFFPGQAVAAWAVSRATGWETALSLVVVSNAAFVAALAFLAGYLRSRFPDLSLGGRATVLAAVGLYPAGLYFRIAYSESLFLACVALLLLGLARRWPVVVLALVAGAATGVRAVGVACTGAVLAHVLLDRERGPLRRRIAECAALGPLACWGLLAFMAHQWAEFGNPFAFADAQRHWGHDVRPFAGITSRWVRLLIAEPVWNAFTPGSQRYWGFIDYHGVPGIGQGFWNPVVLTAAVVFVAVGWGRGVLTRTEGLLGLALLLIPYLSRGHEMSLGSHARFVSVALPSFVVFGRLLARGPGVACGLAFAVMASLLTVWSAMFGAWWPLF